MKIYSINPINCQKSNSVSFYSVKKPLAQSVVADLRVFNHHIYEYKKGIRNLILTTEKSKYKDFIVEKLERENIAYKIDEISDKNINVYFGEQECVDVVKSFNPKLYELSPEQDFMLGIMLGYDRLKQCIRYNKIKSGEIKLGKHPQE